MTAIATSPTATDPVALPPLDDPATATATATAAESAAEAATLRAENAALRTAGAALRSENAALRSEVSGLRSALAHVQAHGLPLPSALRLVVMRSVLGGRGGPAAGARHRGAACGIAQDAADGDWAAAR